MIPAREALARLREGNRRFVEIVGAEYCVEAGTVEFFDD